MLILFLFQFYFLFFFFGGCCFLCFRACKLPTYWALSVLIKKEKIAYEFGSSLETGEDLLELITMPFKLDSWAGFVLEQFSLRLFFVSICSKMY